MVTVSFVAFSISKANQAHRLQVPAFISYDDFARMRGVLRARRSVNSRLLYRHF